MCMNLVVLLVGRLIFASAREGHLPAVFCGVHVTWRTPVAATIFHVRLNAEWVCVSLHV